MQITSVINQITQRIIRGNTAGTSDQLLYTPIEVVRVGIKANTSDYTVTIDYRIVGSTISWSPAGAEPSPGQAYYITYKYNPTQYFKDFDTISQELQSDYNTVLPNLDVSKSAARDLYINVPSRQLVDEYNTARHISLIQMLQNVSELSDAELDAIGVNYSKPRLPATKSSGTAKFYMNIARGYSVTIPVGTKIATMPTLTNNQQITFSTTEAVTILASQLYVLVPIEADNAGLLGNVSANTIVILIDTLDVDGVTNIVATTGGQDQETNDDYAKRLIDVFKARNIATVNGIRGLVLAQPNVIDAYIADVGDSVMVRDGGLGGKVDIYIQSESGFEGEVINEEYVYAGDYVFLKQPVISIVSVEISEGSGPYVTVPSDEYELVKDTGLFQNSTRALDKLRFVYPDIPTPGDLIKISYVYNKLFNDIQDLLDSDAYHRAGIDDLVRGALETFIDVTGAIKIASGYVFADVQTSIINSITDYIEAKEIGSLIVYGDIINIIHDTPGVADLMPLSRLCRSTEYLVNTIQLRGNEYPRAGTITINRIV